MNLFLADFCNLLPLWVATEVSCWTQRTTGESTRQCEVAFWRRLKATPPIQDTQVFADSWDTSVIQWNYYFVLEKILTSWFNPLAKCSPLELCLFYFDQKYSEVYSTKKSHFISIKFSCVKNTVKSGSLDFSQGYTDGGLFWPILKVFNNRLRLQKLEAD